LLNIITIGLDNFLILVELLTITILFKTNIFLYQNLLVFFITYFAFHILWSWSNFHYIVILGQSWLQSYGSCKYIHLCNLCPSPLM